VVALVDPGGLVRDVAIAGSGALRGYAPVNWSGDSRPELAIVWQDKVAVIDPRTGAVLASFDGHTAAVIQFRRATVIDWEQDRDEDALGSTTAWFCCGIRRGRNGCNSVRSARSR
jgi:hypothetical protein